MSISPTSNWVGKDSSRGFSLVETIVAIAIMTAAITGPLYLAYLGIRSSRDAKNELVATNLAAEALELVQARRNAIGAASPVGAAADDASWAAPIVSACSGTNGCIIDITAQDNTGELQNSAFVTCPNAQCISSPPQSRDYARIYLNDNTRIMRQSNANLSGAPWIATPYRRIVRVAYIDNNGALVGPVPPASPTRQVTATATVTYLRSNGTTGVVEVSTDLYNWFPEL